MFRRSTNSLPPLYLNYFQTRLIQTALSKESLREALLRVPEPRTLTDDG